MIRLILHLFLFLFLSSYSCEAYRLSSSDQKVLNSFWKYAEEHRLGNLPVNERIPSIARFFFRDSLSKQYFERHPGGTAGYQSTRIRLCDVRGKCPCFGIFGTI